MRLFHSYLPKLLVPKTGVYSFFNGFCPHNVFFQNVACEVTRIELERIGLRLSFQAFELESPNVLKDETWKDVDRKYYFAKEYFLPVAVQE